MDLPGKIRRELEDLRADQRWARDQHAAGNPQAVLGMSDALAEECEILRQHPELRDCTGQETTEVTQQTFTHGDAVEVFDERDGKWWPGRVIDRTVCGRCPDGTMVYLYNVRGIGMRNGLVTKFTGSWHQSNVRARAEETEQTANTKPV